MITGVHAMFYSSDPDATRAFLRDVLRLPANDVGEGWLIFPVSDAEVAVHPVEDAGETPAGTHNFSFYCDDVKATVADLKSRGAKFNGEIEDMGWGLVARMEIPGGCSALLYQKRY
jgi:catechol 2,3-dioxygenase-like lactoylglutathione lyase family enzyme